MRRCVEFADSENPTVV